MPVRDLEVQIGRCGGADRTVWRCRSDHAGGEDSRFLFVKPKRKWEREREMEVGRTGGVREGEKKNEKDERREKRESLESVFLFYKY